MTRTELAGEGWRQIQAEKTIRGWKKANRRGLKGRLKGKGIGYSSRRLKNVGLGHTCLCADLAHAL